jgi:hypothetical protein
MAEYKTSQQNAAHRAQTDAKDTDIADQIAKTEDQKENENRLLLQEVIEFSQHDNYPSGLFATRMMSLAKTRNSSVAATFIRAVKRTSAETEDSPKIPL